MKESREHIDKLFNEKLNERTFDIPDAFLSDLNSKLDGMEGAKKKRRIIWFILPLILTVAIFAYLMIFNAPQDSKNTAEERKELTNEIVKEETNQDLLKDRDLKSTPSVSKEMKKSEKPQYSSHSNIEDVQLNSSESENRDTPIRGKRKSHLTHNQDLLHDAYLTQNESSTNEKINNNRNLDPKAGVPSQGVNSKLKQKTKANLNSSANLNYSDYTSHLTQRNDDTLKNPEEKIKIVYRDSLVIRDSVVIRDSIVIRDSVVVRDSVINTPRKSKSNWSAELQVFGGFSSSRSKTTSSDSQYLDKMRDEEKPLYSPLFGFNFNTNYKNWTMGTGVFYLQSGEKTYYTSQTENTYDSLYIIGYQTDSVFVEETQTWEVVDTPIYDSTMVTEIIDSTHQSSNQYSWLSIPLNFGYRFNIGSWSIIPRVGLNFDFAIANNLGRYPDTSSGGLTEIASKRFLLSYAIQLEVRKSFARWHIYATPYFRSAFSPEISSNNMNRTYQNWGIIIGVGLSF